MEKELDLTLRLGLPSPAVETHLRLDTSSTTNQRINVDGETHGLRHMLRNENEPIDERHVDVNMKYYNLVFNHFAGIGETLNFAPFPIQPSLYSSPAPAPAPAPANPTRSDYVLIDVPARRAVRNSLASENALNANANPKQRRGCGGCCGGMIGWMRKCTNMNCNTINTPMWRRGPLGPKTLCNACGIKFRKEEERRSKRTW